MEAALEEQEEEAQQLESIRQHVACITQLVEVDPQAVAHALAVLSRPGGDEMSQAVDQRFDRRCVLPGAGQVQAFTVEFTPTNPTAASTAMPSPTPAASLAWTNSTVCGCHDAASGP